MSEQKKDPKLIEIHMLQNHVPANLNRDDLGAPKTAMFGGTLRARISSQCLKRSTRWSDHFREELKADCGDRTGMFPTLIEDALKASELPDDEKKKIVERAGEVAKKEKKDDDDGVQKDEQGSDNDELTDDKTQLIFLGPEDAKKYVKNIEILKKSNSVQYQAYIDRAPQNNKKEKDKAKKLVKQFMVELGKLQKEEFEKHPAVDVALYGRMTTSDVFHNVDASMSVAHAISTHEVIPQTDYWTGVDDEKITRNIPGAGMIQEALFNSATFYKYVSLDWKQLKTNLNNKSELAFKTLRCFLLAFALETPSGKRHAHAHNNLPSAILIEIRDKNVPTNYANAFAKPVTADESQTGDIVFNSAKRLKFYVEQTQQAYTGKPLHRFWFWLPNSNDQKVEIKDAEDFNKEKDDTDLEKLVSAVIKAVGGEA
ncbi:MAG: type I-E CRISPR-associated protein Cas7/Cse4/CasC [Planctomycetes bacterium]|nr:type I-E CRISPR-associated protein Cas7/Cse4/CasC [Planctomycetota bacterium]